MRPFIGVGYSYFNDLTSFGSRDTIISIDEGGFSVNGGLTYDIGRNWFLTAQYDYSNLRIWKGQARFNQSVDLIKIGIGIRF